MSETEQNKSEQATPYKLEQARKKGSVAKSGELGVLAVMVAAFSYGIVAGDEWWVRQMHASERILATVGALDGDGTALLPWLWRALGDAMGLMWPMFGLVFVFVLATMFLQTGFVFAPAALKPDWGRLNPGKGFKRLFSRQTLIEAGKASFKLVVYLSVAGMVIGGYISSLATADLDPIGMTQMLARVGKRLVLAMLVVAVVFAMIDQIISRRQFARQMRMSRHEVKQEFKQREGNPHIKQRRRKLQRELLQRAASARGVRGSDVVVTNPTHYLVGLRYDRKNMAAPKIVAKGAGEFAQQLRRIAFLHGVPIVKSPELTRQLFFQVAQDAEIPETLFRPVADIYLRLPSRGGDGSNPPAN